MEQGYKLDVSRMIDDLGGPTAVSRLLKMSVTAVRHWHSENRVPHWQEQRFASLAKHLPKRKQRKAA